MNSGIEDARPGGTDGRGSEGFSEVIEAFPDPFVLLSPVRGPNGDVRDFVIAAGNALACEVNGVDRGGLVGTRLSSLLPAAAIGVLDTCRAVLDTGDPAVLTDWGYARSGGPPERRFEVYVARVGEGIGHTWRDVTESRQAALRIARSEERLRDALAAELDGHIIADAVRDPSGHIVDFRVMLANVHTADFLGRGLEQIVGRSIRELSLGGRGEQAVELYRSVVESGEPMVLERIPGRAPYGEGRYVDIRVVRAGDGVSVIWHDATATVETEASLTAAREEYRLLAENAADVVVRLNAADEVVWVSASVHRLLGHEPESLLGRRPTGLVHPDDREKGRSALASLRSGAALSATEELRLQHRDGTFSWWQATWRRTSDEPADSDVVLTLRDMDAQVRERDRAEEERARRVAAVWSMLDPHLLVRALRTGDGEVVDLTVADANAAACSALQRPVDQLLGMRLSVLSPGLVGSALFTLCLNALTTGEPVVADGVAYQGDGVAGPLRLDVRGVPLGADGLSVTWRNVTDRYEAAAALAAAEEQFRTAMDAAPVGMAIVSPDASILRVNPALCAFLGRDEVSLTDSTLGEFTHADDIDPGRDALAGLAAGRGDTVRYRQRFLRPDGSIVHGDIAASCVREPGGAVRNLIVQIVDVTAQVRADRALAESEELHRLLTQNAYDVIWTMALDGRVTYVSPSVERVRGITPEEACSQTLDQIHPPESAARVTEYFGRLFAAIADGSEPPRFQGEQEYYRKDGSIMLGELQVIPQIDSDGRVLRILGVTRDISERRRFEEEMSRLAVTDPLTGVWNRRHCEEVLSSDLAGGRDGEAPLSLLMLDVDHFKDINDTHGHQTGDRVLIELCDLITSHLRPADVLARWGGEEFVVLARDCAPGGAALANGIRDLVSSHPFDHGVSVTVSVGVADLQPDDDLDSWLRRADQALYDAKAAGRNTVRVSD